MDRRVKRTITTETGMTFVETLVTSVIGTVLAGMVIVIYMMYDSQARENNAGFTMLMQYDNLSSQIARHAGNAKRVLSVGTFHDTCNITGDTTDTVWFFDESSALVAGIGIAGDTLIERDPSPGAPISPETAPCWSTRRAGFCFPGAITALNST